jgi:hypothetical protein
MGSTNFGDGVYINTWNDIRYWAEKMKKNNVVTGIGSGSTSP